MNSSRYRNAMIGLILWVFLTFLLVTLSLAIRFDYGWVNGISKDARVAVIWITLLVPFFSFFWTADQLAVAKGHSRGIIAIGLFGPLAQLAIFAILLSLPNKCAPQRKRSGNTAFRSSSEKTVSYRGKALPRVVFGFAGIVFSIYLSSFSDAWFIDPENQIIVAFGFFLCGYSAVIAGSCYWIKSKGWHEALVFIGLMPVAMLLVPWVRLIFVIVPPLLPISMLMMPVILLAIVAVLPDKSGMPKRRCFDITKIKELD